MIKKEMRKKIKTVLAMGLVLAIGAGMAACGNTGGDATGEGEGTIKGNVVIAGSTSVQPLSDVLASEFMANNGEVTIDVQGGGSGQGIKAIKEGIADVGALSRGVKDKEKADVAKEITIAMDGVAVIINKDSKVADLSIEQIKKIYTGEIKDWAEVGGDAGKITVVSREEGSGTRGAFTEITGILAKNAEGKEIDSTVTGALIQNSTGSVKSTVANTPGTIGYISLGALDDSVKAVTVEGVAASSETVLAETYLISRPFLYVVGENISAQAQAFIDYILSDEGQMIVEENGFIPVN